MQPSFSSLLFLLVVPGAEREQSAIPGETKATFSLSQSQPRGLEERSRLEELLPKPHLVGITSSSAVLSEP